MENKTQKSWKDWSNQSSHLPPIFVLRRHNLEGKRKREKKIVSRRLKETVPGGLAIKIVTGKALRITLEPRG